jgi:hypothetical protein
MGNDYRTNDAAEHAELSMDYNAARQLYEVLGEALKEAEAEPGPLQPTTVLSSSSQPLSVTLKITPSAKEWLEGGWDTDPPVCIRRGLPGCPA